MLILAIIFISVVVIRIVISNKDLSNRIEKLENQFKKINNVNSHNNFSEVTENNYTVTDNNANDEISKPVDDNIILSNSNDNNKTSTANDKHHPNTSNNLPSEHSWLTKKLITFFTQGNVPAKIGCIILFIGIAFFVKYTAQYIDIPLTVRFIIAAIFALAMIVFGWITRKKQYRYGLILQGGGIAILYLLVFISFYYYHLLSPITTFILFILISLGATIVSLWQDSKELIIIAELGALLTPLLIGNSHGNYIALFSYYVVINITIAIIAWFKVWRILTFIGFLFTFVFSSLWGISNYQNSFYPIIQIFLIIFIILYTLTPIAFSWQKRIVLDNFLDSTLVISTPIVAFIIQCILISNITHGYSYSALGFGVYYLLTSIILWKIDKTKFNLLHTTFFNIAILFLILVPLTLLDHEWLLLIWAAEAVLLMWTGIKNQYWPLCIFAIFLLIILGLANIFYWQTAVAQHTINIEQVVLTTTILLANIISACLVFIYKEKEYWKTSISTGLMTFTLFQWYMIILFCIQKPHYLQLSFSYLFIFSLIWYIIGRQLKWKMLQIIGLSLAFTTIIYLAFNLQIVFHAFWYITLISLLAFIASYLFLYDTSRNKLLNSKIYLFTVINAWGLTVWLIYIAWHFLHTTEFGSAWQALIYGIILTAVAYSHEYKPFFTKKLFQPYAQAINIYVSFPLVLIIFLSTLLANISLYNFTQRIFYIPLLNPIDTIMLISALIICGYVKRQYNQLQRYLTSMMPIFIALGSWYFIWLTTIVLRSVHYYADIPYQFSTLFASQVTQIALTATWAIVGFCLIILANKMKLRWLWWISATLFGIILLKLFFIDLANSTGLIRAISFIGVGSLLLLIGFLSPLPPKAKRSSVTL